MRSDAAKNILQNEGTTIMIAKIFEAPYGDTFNASAHYSIDGKGYMRDGKYFFTSEQYGWLNADWLIVIDSPHSCFYTNIPRERRILFFGEPPEIRDYSQYIHYLEQFGIIVSICDIPNYSGRVIVSNSRLGWTAGIHGELSSMEKAERYPLPPKNRTISIISSLKHRTEYHRKRVEFMRRLQDELSGVIDCFGREFNPVDDKLQAIAPYKYHVVIENSRHKNYWTEKLTDAWAGWALPIYFGDPSILEQVPDKRGIEIIDIDDFSGSLNRIREIIEGDVYASRIDAIKKCRQWALKASNPYELTCEIVEDSDSKTPALSQSELFRILPSKRKYFVYRMLHKISSNLADSVLLSYCKGSGKFWG